MLRLVSLLHGGLGGSVGSEQRLVPLLLGAVGLLVGEVVACPRLHFAGLPSAVAVLAFVPVFVG